MAIRAQPIVRAALLVVGALLGALRPTFAQRAQPPVLTLFDINGGADSVAATEASLVLTHRTVGARPSEYRVSTRADFAGARWVTYVDAPTLANWYHADGEACGASRTTRRVTLFFQVRATIGEEVRITDGQRQLVPSRVESNVLRDDICVHERAPAPTDHPAADAY